MVRHAAATTGDPAHHKILLQHGDHGVEVDLDVLMRFWFDDSPAWRDDIRIHATGLPRPPLKAPGVAARSGG
jgi:hypothetical protein